MELSSQQQQQAATAVRSMDHQVRGVFIFERQ